MAISLGLTVTIEVAQAVPADPGTDTGSPRSKSLQKEFFTLSSKTVCSVTGSFSRIRFTGAEVLPALLELKTQAAT
jgi:hypothetical protein